MDDAYKFFKMKIFEISQIFNDTEEQLEQSFETIKAVTSSRENAMSKLRAIYNK